MYDKEKEDVAFVPEEEVKEPSVSSNGQNGHHPVLQVKKSVQSKNQKANPVAYWKVSNSRINAFAISPDHRHVAVASEDGNLRVIDYVKER